MADPLPYLARLLRVPGVTGEEAAVVAEAAALGLELGFDPQADADGVVFSLAGRAPGPALLLNSHLDTVPAGAGWTYPPHAGRIEGEWIYGRGAADARGPCVAMLLAAAELAAEGLARGRLVVALSIGEEGNDSSLPRLLDRIGPIDAGVIGEPTDMRVATAQRGLLVLELTARGEPGHAARVSGPNAVSILAADLLALQELKLAKEHRELGTVRLTPTRLAAGVADNMTPPKATAVIDVRTTPEYSNAELLVILAGRLRSEIKVLGDAWIPCATPAGPLLAAAKKVFPDAAFFASGAASDWAFLMRRGVPGLKLGPGSMDQAHRPDERISRADLQRGVAGYKRLIRAYLQSSDT